MDHGSQSRHEETTDWQDRLKRFHGSGQTVACFSESEGVSPPSFYGGKGSSAIEPMRQNTFPQPRLTLASCRGFRRSKSRRLHSTQRKEQDWELAYNKLWHERFNARSERYIANVDQLRLDLGDTDEAANAADGLADALEESDFIPAHTRRKPRKKRNESLPSHLPRYEVIAPVAEEIKNCPTHGERTLLPESMWDRVESLEFEPPLLKSSREYLSEVCL